MYSPSTATFACQIPSFLTARSIPGAGSTNTVHTGTNTMRRSDSSKVTPGLITRK